VEPALRSMQVTAKPERITHFETGGVFPLPVKFSNRSAENLFCFVYGAGGFELSQVESVSVREKSLGSPVIISTLRDKLQEEIPTPKTIRKRSKDFYRNSNLPREQVSRPFGGKKMKKKEGDSPSVFPSLWPNYWLPEFSAIPDGILVGAQTRGRDTLERHSFAIGAAYDSRANFPWYDLIYQYDGLYPTIQLHRVQENRYIGLFQESNRITNTSLLLVYPIGFYQVSFGATLNDARYQGVFSQNGGMQARFVRSTFRSFPNSIVPEEGEKGHRSDVTVSGFFTGDNQFSMVEERFEGRLPAFHKQHFFRFIFQFGKSYNSEFPPIPFVGGGQETLNRSQPYLLRGYQVGALFGREIMTTSLEYWFPIKDIYRGRGALPFSRQRVKGNIFVDAGTAEYVGGVLSNKRKWPVGIGANVFLDIKLFYHFPWTIGLGMHYGLSKRVQGELQPLIGLYYTGQ